MMELGGEGKRNDYMINSVKSRRQVEKRQGSDLQWFLPRENTISLIKIHDDSVELFFNKLTVN